MSQSRRGSMGWSRRAALSGLAWSPFAALSLASGALSGCFRPSAPLRVGVNVWPGYEPFFLAARMGFLAGTGVQLLELPSATEVIRAYRNRALDVVAVTADEAIHLAETMAGQRIILVCDISLGADAILARPPVISLAGLRGQRVGVESGALGAYVLSRALELAGMTPSEVVAIPLPIDEHEAAYSEGTVDALVTFEPVRGRLMARGARAVFDSAQIPGEILDVLVTREDVMEDGEAQLRRLAQAWFRALDYLRVQPQDAAGLVAARGRFTQEAFLSAYRLIDLPDVGRNRRLLMPGADGLEPTLQRLVASMMGHRLLSRPVPVGELLENRFLPEGRP